ncbi:hypothetical protein [Alcanivorax quisquiliarum]|uniref:DUF1893 domain-containing protein n=1 Tax=Alcanivorax quisquiliarum TaxID=2933565 RepID=A0ABT0E2R4_9GAMM|nr:hypothetical protein [Alcanivorax quisquiliarum]MCK0536105.1 hypothetical protein [Alcanivorax quisquiliarum]
MYAQDIRILAEQYEEVEYLGVISASDAAALVAEHWWALLPIDDEVTRYAFPSKSSGYALAGAAVAAICGDETSVARWVKREGVGLVCPPHKSALVRFFSELEDICIEKFGASDQLKKRLAISSFSASLREVADKLSSA